MNKISPGRRPSPMNRFMAANIRTHRRRCQQSWSVTAKRTLLDIAHPRNSAEKLPLACGHTSRDSRCRGPALSPALRSRLPAFPSHRRHSCPHSASAAFRIANWRDERPGSRRKRGHCGLSIPHSSAVKASALDCCHCLFCSLMNYFRNDERCKEVPRVWACVAIFSVATIA